MKIVQPPESSKDDKISKLEESITKLTHDIKEVPDDNQTREKYEDLLKEIEYMERHPYHKSKPPVPASTPSAPKAEAPRASPPESTLSSPVEAPELSEPEVKSASKAETPQASAPLVISAPAPVVEITIKVETSAKESDSSPEIPSPAPSTDSEKPVPEASAPALLQTSEPPRPPQLHSEDLTSVIEGLRADLLIEQSKRETDLLQKIEASFAHMIQEYSPTFTSNKDTPARVLSRQIDFSKSTVEELQKKYEALIFAYEDRLESLGVKNYDAFIERLKMQKRKWKERMELSHDEYLQELRQKIEERDAHWNNFLILEQEDSEQHYEQQARIDKQYTMQETELKMTIDFEGKLQEITESLEQATNNRLKQLEEITGRIKQMEVIIVNLKNIHNVHASIGGLQRTLSVDKGSLTHDLQVVAEAAKYDAVIMGAVLRLEEFYPEMVEKGIPKIRQIQNRFDEASQKARRAALLTSKSFFNVLASRLAVKLIPRNIRTVDDADTYSVLKMTEEALEREDLREALRLIGRLQGYPREEMEGVARDISLRLAITELVDALTRYTVSSVQNALTGRAY